MVMNSHIDLPEKVVIPMRFKRVGGRKRIVVPSEVQQVKQPPVRDESLLKALGRAFRWRELLSGDQFETIEELARAEKVDASYLARMMRLTLLSPRLVEAVLEGRQPAGLTLPNASRPFPMDWDEQEEWFGK